MTDFKRRRSDSENVSNDKYNGSERRYYDRPKDQKVINLHTGDFYVVDKPNYLLMTILGSCVAACIRDPITGIGGMNHFLLPKTNSEELKAGDKATRYGAYAMEQLINGILKKGGHRDRLEVKVFGGANVIKQQTQIGSRNVEFVRQYLRDEGFKIISEDLGGDYPRRIHYYPDTGKVMMRNLRRKDDMEVVEEERRYEATISSTNSDGNDVDLF